MKLPVGYVAGQGVVKATAHGGFGEKLLKQMGWSNGEGLGKTRSGISSAIEVKKKEDTVGIGGNAMSYQWDDKWWEKAFDSAAQQTTIANDTDSSDSDTDSDEDIAPAQLSERTFSQNRDGTRTTASKDELKLLKELSKSGRLAAGRFGGRDGKMARIRAQEAEMALKAASQLGIPSAPSASERSDTTSDAHLSNGAAPGSKSGKKSKSGKTENTSPDEQPAKKQRIVIETKSNNADPIGVFVPTPKTGWWGAKMFISAGCLAGAEQEARKKRGFTEDDQAAIYNAAQQRKTQGRLGIGQSTGTLKVGGVKWAGNKVSFEEVENDDAEPETNKSKKQKSKLKAVGSSNHLDTAAEEDSSWIEEIKWKKIVRKTLEEAPKGKLKMKKLIAGVKTVVESKLDGKITQVSIEQIESIVLKTVESSSKYVVDGKYVQFKS